MTRTFPILGRLWARMGTKSDPRPFNSSESTFGEAEATMTSANGSGEQVIGGCCGIGPGHIRALRENLPKSVQPKEPQ